MSHVVLVGCGHAHLPLICALNVLVDSGHRVTVINPSAHLYYPGMSPGYVGDEYHDDELRINVAALVRARGAQFLEGAVDQLDVARRTLSVAGRALSYDLASLNVGSTTALSSFTHLDTEALYTSIFPAKPTQYFLPVKERLWHCFARAHATGRRRVVSVIGGGPAAVEIANNIRALYAKFRSGADATAIVSSGDSGVDLRGSGAGLGGRGAGLGDSGAGMHRGHAAGGGSDAKDGADLADRPPLRARAAAGTRRAARGHARAAAPDLVTVRLFHGHDLLRGHRRALGVLSTRALLRAGVELCPAHVPVLYARAVVTAAGRRYPSDLTVVATGIEAPAFIRATACTTDSFGALHVNTYLQSVDAPDLFAAGDCAHFMPHPLPKVGVYAVRQGATIKHNVIASAAARASATGSRPAALPLLPFRPQRRFFFSLNIGHGRGIATKYRITWQGRSAFSLKERFDRAFMEYYQRQ